MPLLLVLLLLLMLLPFSCSAFTDAGVARAGSDPVGVTKLCCLPSFAKSIESFAHMPSRSDARRTNSFDCDALAVVWWRLW